MSYVVRRNKTNPKILKEATFASYEEARNSTRKYIRANFELAPGANPAISDYGYRIEQVQQVTA